MPKYVIELYLSGMDEAAIEATAERARAATIEVSQEGTAIHYLGALFLRAEETCFHLFEAASGETVAEVGRRCVGRYERLVEAVQIDSHAS